MSTKIAKATRAFITSHQHKPTTHHADAATGHKLLHGARALAGRHVQLQQEQPGKPGKDCGTLALIHAARGPRPCESYGFLALSIRCQARSCAQSCKGREGIIEHCHKADIAARRAKIKAGRNPGLAEVGAQAAQCAKPRNSRLLPAPPQRLLLRPRLQAGLCGGLRGWSAVWNILQGLRPSISRLPDRPQMRWALR